MDNIYNKVKEKAQKWLEGNYSEESKKEVKHLLENDKNGLIDAFYKDLEFGTGGLRGIMGYGSNRMNIYTVGMAAQGLANYTITQFPKEKLKVAIAYDCRNNSKLFAQTVANIFSANGFKVYLFEDLRPTPELSYAIRYYGCQTGIVITASHNPKEYNGFKAYWNDGSQLVPPHDENVITEVEKLTVDDVKFTGIKENIEIIGNEIDKAFLQEVKNLSLNADIIKKHHDIKIIYTPIHGTGKMLIPQSLKNYGFTNIIDVPEQNVLDGNFPTVIYPNPEEAEALTMAIAKAKETNAELVMASDPDADRVAIAVKNLKGEYELLNGNQTGALIINYLLENWIKNNKIKGNEYIVKTIVTSELISDIATKNNIEYFDTLTGFKNIAIVIRELEGKKTYIGGGEESYGYLLGEFVRDKDAVSSCSIIAEMTAVAKENGRTVYQELINIYQKYGFYKESLVNVVRKGMKGAEEIENMMINFRNNPPKTINNSKVVKIQDYKISEEKDLTNGKISTINIAKSNVLQFYTEDGSKISVRPSGTEPKIKFYFSVKTELNSINEFEEKNNELSQKITNIINDLKL
jgi:phosphoglucomutase